MIATDLLGKSKFEIIEELLDLLHKDKRLIDRDIALQDILAREGHLSTGLENGLAIPHAKSDGVPGLEIAFGLKRDGVDFESLDGKKVHLVFLFLSPKEDPTGYVKLLGKIARLLDNGKLREALKQAETPEAIINTIKEAERKLR